MFLSEPGHTNYDLNFRLFGFPIRIHPAFFILPIFFAAGQSGAMILVFVLVFFISILIHELGHAFVMRYFGQPARIVLYIMGGLAIPDSGGPWSRPAGRSFTNQQQILVSLAGPLAGFLLAIVFFIIILAVQGQVFLEMWGLIPIFSFSFLDSRITDTEILQRFLAFGLLINVYLNLLNLAPVYPLDGGQISRGLFVAKDPWNGVRNSIILSIVVAIAIALFALSSKATFIAVFFGFSAWSNWMMIQQIGGGGFGGPKRW